MALIETHRDGGIATITMNRPEKRNAMSDAFIAELEAAFAGLSDGIRVVILTGTGGPFCAGLDLAEHEERSAEEGIYHSRNWHRILDLLQFGGKPVIGGGLEIAAAPHVRLANPSTIFRLPEGLRAFVEKRAPQCR